MTTRALRPIFFLLPALCLCAADPTPRQLIENGHYRRARAILESRLHAAPEDPEALSLTCRLKLLAGERDAALPLAERTVKLDPNNSLYHAEFAQALGEVIDHSTLAQQIKLGNQLKAELQAALALDPNNVDALLLQHSIYHNAPAIFGGSKEKARQVEDKIAQIDPVQGYFLQAQLAGEAQQNDRIEPLYRKAVEADPNSYLARIRLAFYCLRAARKFADPETNAREALRINPGRADAYDLPVAALVQQSKWADLEAALTRGRESVPDDLKPSFNAAVRLVTRGVELDRAARYLNTYLSQEPELFAPSHAFAHWRLGQVFEKQGNAAGAASEYQASLKLDPASPAKTDLEKLRQPAAASSPAAPPSYTASH